MSEKVLKLGYINADEYNIFINDAVVERVEREMLEAERQHQQEVYAQIEHENKEPAED